MSCITEEEYKAMCKARPQSVFIYTHPALYDEVDKYWSKYSSPEWLIICQWFYAFYKDIIDAKQGRINPQDNREYVWVNYGLLAQRLGCYGIRNPDTIGKWLSRLSANDDKYPPLLYKWVYFDLTTGHSNVYLAPTEACHRMFAVPKTAEGILEYKKRRALAESTEGSQIPTEDAEVPVPSTQKDSEIPDDWFPIFAQIRECGFYKDKADRDTKGEVFGYNQKLYTYITEILDGTFYDNAGKNITNRHNLEGLTKDQILEWITKENRIPAGGTDYAYRTIVYTTSKATYSPLLNALCGNVASVKTKPKSFYEADKPDNTPNWIWESNQLPDLYPEIQQDDRKFWGFYVNAIEYINDCQKKEGMDRNNWGMWTKLNNGLTNPPNNLFMDIFRAAKKANIGLEEIYSLKFGDVNNFLWILTAREMKQNHSIKILPEGNNNEYVYGTGPLNRAKYERRN